MINFRFAIPQDIPTILNLIHELAIYEKLLDEVLATEETLADSLFDENQEFIEVEGAREHNLKNLDIMIYN
jgi:hypothetical protein